MNRYARTCGFLLAGLLSICLFYGFRNSNALLSSDQYSYLSFGKALARGSLYQRYDPYKLFEDRVSPGVGFNLHYGTRNYKDGRIYSGLPIGFPIILGIALKIGATPFAINVNVIMLFLFTLAYFLTVREFFWSDPRRNIIALISVIMILSVDYKIIPRYSLILMRDLPAITFLWMGIFLLLRARRSRPAGTVTLIFFSVLILGFSSTIRITNAIICIPLALFGFLYFGRRAKKRKNVVIMIIVGFLLFLLAFSPVMIENWNFNRNPFLPFAVAWNSFTAFFSGTGNTHFSFDFFLRHFLPNLTLVWRAYLIPGLILIVAGAVVLRRRAELWLILLLPPLLNLLFFSMFEEDFQRYIVPLFPFLTVLCGRGAVALLCLPESLRIQSEGGCRKASFLRPVLIICLIAAVWISREGVPIFDWRVVTAVIVSVSLILPASVGKRVFSPAARMWVLAGALGLPLAGQLIREGVRRHSFGLGEIGRLRAEIEQYVPPGSIVWGARYLIQNIDYYTHAWSLDPQPLCIIFSLSMKEVNQRVLDAGIPLFILDNKGIRTASPFLYQIDRSFDLEKVKSWKSDYLGLLRDNFSQNEWLTLYRIRPWSEEPVELELSTPQKIDYLVLLDLKDSIESGESLKNVRLFANGTEIMGGIIPGLNFIHLPSRSVSSPETSLRLVSEDPIPREVLIGVVPAVPGYFIEAGRKREISDFLFLEQGFLDDSRSGKSRAIDKEGWIRIPFYYLDGYQPVLKLKVKNNLGEAEPLKLHLTLDTCDLGYWTVEARPGWQILEIPIPPGLGQPLTSRLTLSALRRQPVDAGWEWFPRAGLLSIKWVFFEQERKEWNNAEDPVPGG